MTEIEWGRLFKQAGLTEDGVERAISLVPVLQPLLDVMIAEAEGRATCLGDRKNISWEVAGFMRRVVDAIALRDDVVRRFNGLSDLRHHQKSRSHSVRVCKFCEQPIGHCEPIYSIGFGEDTAGCQPRKSREGV